MEAYNFSAGASITTVHTAREREGTSVKSTKTIAKSVLSIATNITSGSEEEEDKEERMDDASNIKIHSMEMIISKQNSLQDTEDKEEESDSTDNNKEEETDQESKRAQEQALILNDNMNRTTANLQLSSSN
jgi:hypothetical protein